MRRIALCLGLVALSLPAGCKTPAVDPRKLVAIETDPRDGTATAPPGPGDVSRKLTGDRARVAKAVYRQFNADATGDFAIDDQRGPLPFQKSTSVESRIRSLRGFGPGGGRFLVEIRPEGADCLVIVRGEPQVDEAAALVLLDQIEADLKK